jgi:putative addiction module component (TIGR02574 family)
VCAENLSASISENQSSLTVVAGADQSQYLARMKLAEIEQEVLALPERERATLAARLLDTLPPPGTDVSDAEVEQREQELESGHVAAISHEEFVLRVQQQRGR